MSKLPAISGRDAIRAFAKIGFVVDRQHGSHVVLRHADPPHRRLVVPNHDELAKGTLRQLIRDSGLAVQDFIALL